MKSTTWRRCWNDPSIWRIFHVRPDRELLVTIDRPRMKLLAFELEWEDTEGHRRYLSWSTRSGFDVGVVDLEEAPDVPEGRVGSRVPSKASPGTEDLEWARRIVESSGLDDPVGGWIVSRLRITAGGLS